MEGLWTLTKGLMTPSLDQHVGTPGFPIRASLTPRSDHCHSRTKSWHYTRISPLFLPFLCKYQLFLPLAVWASEAHFQDAASGIRGVRGADDYSGFGLGGDLSLPFPQAVRIQK